MSKIGRDVLKKKSLMRFKQITGETPVLLQFKSMNTGNEAMVLTVESMKPEVLRRYTKKGWIRKDLFEKNRRTIVQYENLSEWRTDTRKRIKELREIIKDNKEWIKMIKTDEKYKAWRPHMLEAQIKTLKKDTAELKKLEKELKESNSEYKVLRSKIKRIKKESVK